MSSNFDNKNLTRESLLQRAAAGLQEQFQSVVFQNDRHLRSLRFAVTTEASISIRGLLEYDGDLEDALEKIRPVYAFQTRSRDGLEPTARLIDATISPLVKPAGWDDQDDMPSTFELEIRIVEPKVTIPFPTNGGENGGGNQLREVVFVIHGIRDRARWQSRVKRILEEIDGVKVIPIKFGYLDVFRFWFPIGTRGQSIEFTREQIQIGKNRYKAEHYSVVAHSFGTYAISNILADTKDLVLHRLILCGCIVKRRFPWDSVSGRINTEVINDFGTRDIWPLMASKLSWGYDETGRFGFGRADVTDRAHDFEHSDFFAEDFIRAFWKPWFESGTYTKSNWEEEAPPSPWLLDAFSALPVKSILCVLIPAICVSIYWFWQPIYAFVLQYWMWIVGGIAGVMLLAFVLRKLRKK
jgi:pimeloyl-ACP methyl ester carboxylesterase